MRAIYQNNKGDLIVDPANKKGQFEKWYKEITSEGQVNYFAIGGISAPHSEIITRYVLDLAAGKNTAKGKHRGPRSYVHLVHVRYRLKSLFRIFESQHNKINLDFTEDEVLATFNAMREGKIHNVKGKPFLDVSTYAKVFSAFWRWYMRTNKEKKILSIIDSLDTRADHKPKWHHFTLAHVEQMCLHAPSFEYEALMWFLFDSGIRAPKEMMNVRVQDLTPILGTNYLHLNIRDETSKTFGRKIKLMLCSEKIKKHIAHYKLQPSDFLFSKSPVVYNRMLALIGNKTLGIGKPHQQYTKAGYKAKKLIREGITMYDFRHNSVCHYLPIYKSENQMKYRYGWKKSDMIHYYSEFIGMSDTITDEQMLVDTTKTQLEQDLFKEKQRVAFLEEKMTAQQRENDERFRRMEAMLLQRFAEQQ